MACRAYPAVHAQTSPYQQSQSDMLHTPCCSNVWGRDAGRSSSNPTMLVCSCQCLRGLTDSSCTGDLCTSERLSTAGLCMLNSTMYNLWSKPCIRRIYGSPSHCISDLKNHLVKLDVSRPSSFIFISWATQPIVNLLPDEHHKCCTSAVSAEVPPESAIRRPGALGERRRDEGGVSFSASVPASTNLLTLNSLGLFRA